MASMTDNSSPRHQTTGSGAGASACMAPDDWGLRRRLIAGVVATVLFVATVFGWASVAQLSGAIIAPGTIVVEGHSKKVQHAHGGVVSRYSPGRRRTPTWPPTTGTDRTSLAPAPSGAIAVQLTKPPTSTTSVA